MGTIENDDIPPIFISVEDVTLPEGDTGTTAFTFEVTLSEPGDEPITVDYATADATATSSGNAKDYNKSSGGSLTFAPGQTSQIITVDVIGDSNSETDETFLINLSNPNNAVILGGQGLGTITNDDAEPVFISIADASVLEGDGQTALVFTVTLSRASTQTVTVDFGTADGTATSSGNAKDYQRTKGTLTFSAGETSKTITVLVNGDSTVEPNETFFLNLSNATDAIFADSQGLGTILDDDTIL